MTNPYPGNSHWPADFQGCTLTGSYVGLDGVPVAGNIVLSTPVEVLLDFGNNKVIVPRSLSVPLDVDGAFSILVPATDDPDISPRGWTYTIHENWVGGRTYPINAPQNTTVDVTEQAPVPDALGNPIVRGPRGIDGVLQNVEVNGTLGTINFASDADISDLVLDKRLNLDDVPDPAAARSNLGVGTAGTFPEGHFDLAGAASAALAAAEAHSDAADATLTADVADNAAAIALLPRGRVGSATRVANMGITHAEAFLAGLSDVAFTAVVGRRYKLTVSLPGQLESTTSNTFEFYVRDGGVNAPIVTDTIRAGSIASINAGSWTRGPAWTTELVGLAAGVHRLGLTAQTDAALGVQTMHADATRPALLLIEDIGT